ncbi:MAG: hypothetical protein JWO49_1981 [Arthrobacter sp.]|nr:hypothetical protein [Arthrobacter sp.]
MALTDTVLQRLFKGSGTALMVRGIIAILFGILVLAVPGVTLLTLVLLFGVYAILDGATNIAHYFSRDKRRSGWQLAGGIISILAGVVALVWPGVTALSLALVIGAWAMVLGASQVALAFDVKKTVPHWWVWLITGIVTILFGLFVLFAPDLGLLSLLGLLAGYAILAGALLITSGLQLRKLEPRVAWSDPDGGQPAH